MPNDKNTLELNDKQLESVSGGTSTSTWTYKDLGIPHNSDYQRDYCHPVIVTIANFCSLDISNNHFCLSCIWSQWSGGSLYCECRSEENDPCNGGIKVDPFADDVGF